MAERLSGLGTLYAAGFVSAQTNLVFGGRHRQESKVVVPKPLGLSAMYTGPRWKGIYPEFIAFPVVTNGPSVPVVVYEYSSVSPLLA